MADDTPASPIGTSALRRTVAGVRAGAGAASRIAPAPPPDQAESPWAGFREPRPATQADERRAEAVAAVTAPPKARKPKPTKQEDTAYELVNAILMKWRRDVTSHNIGYANNQLARELMRNGAVLIKAGYEIDKLSALIRLSNELVKNTLDEGDDDKRITAFAEKLARTDLTSTVPENANAGEEEPPESEDGENGD